MDKYCQKSINTIWTNDTILLKDLFDIVVLFALQFWQNLLNDSLNNKRNLLVDVYKSVGMFKLYIIHITSEKSYQASRRHFFFNLKKVYSSEIKKINACLYQTSCSVSWGCRIHWLHSSEGVKTPPPNKWVSWARH